MELTYTKLNNGYTLIKCEGGSLIDTRTNQEHSVAVVKDSNIKYFKAKEVENE